MSASRVYVLDEVDVRPGLAAQYRDAYRTEYVPAAERRGMRLEHCWQDPPVQDVPEVGTTLCYLWSVEGAKGWWAMRLSRRPDGSDERPDKEAWWQRSAAMTTRRVRRVLSDRPAAG